MIKEKYLYGNVLNIVFSQFAIIFSINYDVLFLTECYVHLLKFVQISF